MTLAALEERFLALALDAVAAQSPYVWGGKGDVIWTPTGVKPNPFRATRVIPTAPGSVDIEVEVSGPRDVFDCSGLITTCLHRAGGPDLRFSHGAKQLREACPPMPAISVNGADRLRLRFYPGHVALHLRAPDQTPTELNDDRAILIEAAGGDQTTLAPTPRGHVRRGHDLRGSYLSEGSLSALVRQLMPELT